MTYQEALNAVEEVRQLCMEQGWFTVGDSEQYERMFELIRFRKDCRDVARVIWVCSNGIDYSDIEKTLKTIYNEDERMNNIRYHLDSFIDRARDAEHINELYASSEEYRGLRQCLRVLTACGIITQEERDILTVEYEEQFLITE